MAVTSGKAWRDRRAVEFVLPSGYTVLLRPLNGSFLLRLPNIPDHLTGVVADLVGEAKTPDVNKSEDLHRWYAMLDYIARATFVSPRIVDDPQSDDEISISDIDDEDRLWLLQLVNKGVRELETFRAQQTKDVDDMENESGDGRDTPRRNF